MRRWEREDFLGSSTETAEKLMGALLVHETAEGRLAIRITECEAYGGTYGGQVDDASHAYKGRTKRTEPMFSLGGHAYVYLIYGMYCCMNVVCDAESVPAAVLIRSGEPLEGIERMGELRNGAKGKLLTTGPGRLAMAMGISREQNQLDMTKGSLYIESDDTPYSFDCSPRIHIDYAEKGKTFPWRYTLRQNPWVSKS